MKIGLFTTFMSPQATPDMIADLAVRIENLGVESLWMGEHVVLFDEMEFPYPASKDGKIPVPEGGGLLDTVSTFGYLAACTKTLRFGTGITLLPQRNPIYTAKEFATLDWLTNGRMEFGIGVGWCKEEVIACGYTWEDRGARCDEFLDVTRMLWTEELTSYQGKHVQLDKVRMDPKPIQKPHIPIIVGGHSKVGLRRAAKYGNGWYGFSLTPEMTAGMLKDLDTALAAEGRTREGFEIVITPPYNVNAVAKAEYAALGVDQLVLHLGNQKPERINARLVEVQAVLAA